jgi:hypothetical protein
VSERVSSTPARIHPAALAPRAAVVPFTVAALSGASPAVSTVPVCGLTTEVMSRPSEASRSSAWIRELPIVQTSALETRL